MGQIVTNKIDFSAITSQNYPPVDCFIVGFDTADDKLKKMDHDGVITEIVGSSSSIQEAPIDGNQYTRQDGGWSISTGGLVPPYYSDNINTSGSSSFIITSNDASLELGTTSPSNFKLKGYNGVEIRSNSQINFIEMEAAGFRIDASSSSKKCNFLGTDVSFPGTGYGLELYTGGSADLAGTGNLQAGGTTTIITSNATTTNCIIITPVKTGSDLLGSLFISSINSGSSFSVKSTNVSDACAFNWLIIKTITPP